MRDRYVDGQLLRVTRLDARMTQTRLAELAGASLWHLCRVENDAAYCSDLLALRLADALEVDVDTFTRPGVHPRNAGHREEAARRRPRPAA